LGGVKTDRMKENLHLKGRRTEGSESPVYKGREAL
jgi:hypothetical protein